MNWDQVKACTVPVLDQNGQTRGTGFFISSDGHLLTCAHVVEMAGGPSNVRVNGRPVTVEYLGSRHADDFAVLKIENHSGKGVALSADFTPMNRFLSVGYGRTDFPAGASIDGAVTDINPQSNFGNLPMMRLRVKADSQRVQAGYSGSAVYDTQRRSVVGMIAAFDHTQGALAVPVAVMLEKYPALKKLLFPPAPASVPTVAGAARVFISYRGEDPDMSLAEEFFEGLSAAGHETFMAGESLRLGDDWPKRINEELERCDYFLLLLSAKSAASEMVTAEVAQAKRLYDSRPDNAKKPRILPVRVNFPFDEPLNYDLRGYLGRIQQVEWRSATDSPRILREILNVVSQGKDVPLDESQPKTIRVETPDRPPMPAAEPELPEGQVAMASAFYIERPGIESECFTEIKKPGALIVVRSPRQMGKTSLMARILHQAKAQGNRTIALTLQGVTESTLSNLTRFLRWMCARVGRELNLPNRLNEFWDDEFFDAKDNCTDYFRNYLLIANPVPVTIGLDEVDCLFDYPSCAEEFFGLLRAWHEFGKDDEIWKKLRLVIVHSTEVYISVNVNQSPFNVGLPIRLSEFDFEQVSELVRRYGLRLRDDAVRDLMESVGGHPFLVRVPLYHLAGADGKTALRDLLNTAHTEAGMYGDHLRRHLMVLERHPELKSAMERMICSDSPVRLSSEHAFKLEGSGLVKRQGNDVTIRFGLYRKFFRDRFRV